MGQVEAGGYHCLGLAWLQAVLHMAVGFMHNAFVF